MNSKIKKIETVWYDEDILKGLEDIKKFIIKVRPQDFKNRGYEDRRYLMILLIDELIKILKKSVFQNNETTKN